jgi:hypothetical protein
MVAMQPSSIVGEFRAIHGNAFHLPLPSYDGTHSEHVTIYIEHIEKFEITTFEAWLNHQMHRKNKSNNITSTNMAEIESAVRKNIFRMS